MPVEGLTPRPSGPYQGATIHFGTRHGKQHQVAAAFADILAATVEAPEGIDTDQFGTFSGEIPRTVSPIEAARAKARLAMSLTGGRYALASEGSYGPSPASLLPVHEELMIFVDMVRGIEIVEGERVLFDGPGPIRVATVADARGFLKAAGFGRQAVIVRPAVASDQTAGTLAHVRKGIIAESALAEAIQAAASASADGQALVEPDLRAHHNPSRQEILRRLGERLARRLATPCPACGAPGFGRTASRPGLACEACGDPTELVAADVFACPACTHQLEIARRQSPAGAQWCLGCNP